MHKKPRNLRVNIGLLLINEIKTNIFYGSATLTTPSKEKFATYSLATCLNQITRKII